MSLSSSVPFRIVVLFSGYGSNLQAIIDAIDRRELPAEIGAAITNNPNAPGIKRAIKAGIPTHTVDHRSYTTRNDFEHALIRIIDAYAPQLIVLAGFMRILGSDFIAHYAGRLVNIHPSLLPDFPGLKTHERAIASGAKYHGASVHFVTNEVDTGPVIAQTTIPILAEDTSKMLAARVLEAEHRIYPLALRWLAQNRLSIINGRVLLDGEERPEQGLNRSGRE